MSLSVGEVVATAAELLDAPVVEAVALPAGYANETWRVTTGPGAAYVVKIGPPGYESKWRSAHRALDLAASVGVPVAPLVRSAAIGDRLVRAFAWIEGRTPDPGVLGAEGVRRLFTDLGVALRALHGIEFAAFSSGSTARRRSSRTGRTTWATGSQRSRPAAAPPARSRRPTWPACSTRSRA